MLGGLFMQLKSILDICQANETEKFNYTVLKGSTDTEVTGIASDSRKVTEGGIFVCIVGAVSDGHKYIEQVKDKAAVIVVQKGSDYALPSENVSGCTSCGLLMTRETVAMETPARLANSLILMSATSVMKQCFLSPYIIPHFLPFRKQSLPFCEKCFTKIMPFLLAYR